MRKILFAFSFSLFAWNCGSGITITKSWCADERGRIISYYDNRTIDSFDSHFYDECDSIAGHLPSADSKVLAPMYKTIQSWRYGDSTNQHKPIFYAFTKDIINVAFDMAKGVAT